MRYGYAAYAMRSFVTRVPSMLCPRVSAKGLHLDGFPPRHVQQHTTMADATATPSNSTPLGQDCPCYDLELVPLGQDCPCYDLELVLLLIESNPGKADFSTAPDTRTGPGTRAGPGIRGSWEIGFPWAIVL